MVAFFWAIGGGFVLGLAISLLAISLSRRLQSAERQALVAVVVAYLGFLAGEAALGVSGIVATLVTGFFFGRATRADFSADQETFQTRFWGLLGHIAGGLRGAVTLALALAVPVDLPAWWTVQAIAFGVVAFTLVLQAPMVRRMAGRRLESPRD